MDCVCLVLCCVMVFGFFLFCFVLCCCLLFVCIPGPCVLAALCHPTHFMFCNLINPGAACINRFFFFCFWHAHATAHLGAACMNNTFCLGIFLALIYVKGLEWEFSAETISIFAVQVGQSIGRLFDCPGVGRPVVCGGVGSECICLLPQGVIRYN